MTKAGSCAPLAKALDIFRVRNPGVTVNEIITFLRTCDHEGVSVQELAFLSGLAEPTASRSIRSFGPPGSEWARPPACGLVEAFVNPADARSRVIYLTEEGRSVRDMLTALIAPGGALGAGLRCDDGFDAL